MYGLIFIYFQKHVNYVPETGQYFLSFLCNKGAKFYT